jgi:hypothetical protein
MTRPPRPPIPSKGTRALRPSSSASKAMGCIRFLRDRQPLARDLIVLADRRVPKARWLLLSPSLSGYVRTWRQPEPRFPVAAAKARANSVAPHKLHEVQSPALLLLRG